MNKLLRWMFTPFFSALVFFRIATSQDGHERLLGPAQPVVVGVMQDISLSGDRTRIPFISAQQLASLLEIVKENGGELGFGLIADQSNRTLIRVRIDRQPQAPVVAAIERNPFFAVQQRKAYQRALKNYEKKLSQWNEEFAQASQLFIDSVAKDIHGTRRGNTDVWGAVKRLNLFLAEDAASWGKEPLKFALLITDGENTVRKTKVIMTPVARVIIVNGSAAAGNLAELKPLAFESIDSAIRYIETIVRKGGNNASSRAPTFN
jgi:hypothetical protein